MPAQGQRHRRAAMGEWFDSFAQTLKGFFNPLIDYLLMNQ